MLLDIKKIGVGSVSFRDFLELVAMRSLERKKFPGISSLEGRGRHAPWRPFEFGFREKIARGKKVARSSKSFRLKYSFEGRLVPSVDQPLKKRSSAAYRGAYNWGG